jgi:cell division protein FtsZ
VAGGDGRAVKAAQAAIASPLLETSMDGARGVLMNITGGTDLALFEVSEAAQVVQKAADADANIIFGAVIDERLDGEIRITVIATGFEGRPRDDLDEPGEEAGVAEGAGASIPRMEHDDLDIPAFLRKR